ncbi:MAG: anthranilate synthase component I [Gammaproteobacteria bacterium]|nr:anthranilate synthase component I [Gammaproteobacteria bacterium]MBI5616432.1 anthranilate synthase component I [Gammaproteobacteria bacterium]
MTPQELASLAAQGYNRVPIIRHVLADLDTPLSVYLKLAAGPYSCLLESVEGGEKWGRYSIIGLPARQILRVRGHDVELVVDGAVHERHTLADPLAFIRDFHGRFKAADHAIGRFAGGLVGYFGYDTMRYVEPRLERSTPRDTLATPDILLMVADEFVVFDNLKGEMRLVCYVDPNEADVLARAESRLDELMKRLAEPVVPPAHVTRAAPVSEADFVSEFGREAFMGAVERIKHYIVDGDVMQVVPSQRMSIPLAAPPIDVYRALRHLNPSPYLFYFDLETFQIAGSSPEILVRLDDCTVTTRPLAGTRRRGATREEDLALEKELLADPKEIAEHLMLIDLGRNDIGRVAQTGSVRVTEKMVIERYSHVMHISSNVEGRLLPGRDAIDVLRATLPVGTLSGAPKIRAMEIIDELEPVKRGVYGGAVGYLSWNGNMDTAIAIRTAVIKDSRLYIQAGCGVVADSVPETEWEETISKGRAMFRAVAMAERGLTAEPRSK